MNMTPFWQAVCLILAPFGIVLLGILLIDLALTLYSHSRVWIYKHAINSYRKEKNATSAYGFDRGWDACCNAYEISIDDVERTLNNRFLPKEEKQKRVKIMRPLDAEKMDDNVYEY